MKTLKLISTIFLLNFVLFSCDSDDDNDPVSCEDAIMATLDAAEAFNNADDNEYEALCNDYKSALEDQIDSCGDPTGELQNLIDDLEDCTLVTNPGAITGVVSVVVGTLTKTFETNITMTMDGNTRQITAEDDATSDWIYFEIDENATGDDVISNFNIHLISSDYHPLPDDEGGNWESNVSVNTASNINGTFFGNVTSPTTGADISLTSGVIDIDLD